jgi:hypothetical protein
MGQKITPLKIGRREAGVEHLPSMHKTLGSTPVLSWKKKKKISRGGHG